MQPSLKTIATLFALFAAVPALAAPHDNMPQFAVTGKIAGPDGFWDLLAVDTQLHRLYVGHGDRVTSVDLDSGKVTPKLLGGEHVHAAIPLSGGRVLATNGDTNTATVADGATGKLIATIPTGKDPDNAIPDPASGLILVMDHEGGDITFIDPETLTSPGRLDVGGELEQGAATGTGKVFVNLEDKNQVAVIDTKTRKVAAYYKLPGCEGPTGLAYDAKTDLILSACGNETAVVLRASDGSVVTSLKIGKGPDGAIFDPARNLFFVPCGRDGVMDVIAMEDGALKVVASVPTAVGARTATLDPTTGKIYLPTADFDFKNAQPGKRPTLVPGSFRILVVSEKS